MKILITGGAGYLGSVLIPHLLSKGHNITVIDNLFYQQTSLLGVCGDKNFDFILGDARDERLLRGIIGRFDVLIPLACIVGAPACERHSDLAVSVNLEAVKTLNSLRSLSQMLIFPTTNSGYGIGQKDAACTEESPLKPISLYGRTKVEAEKMLLDTGNAVTLRLATVFGISPRMRLDLLVNDFVWKALKDRVLVLFEEHFRRNFIHICDVAMTFNYCIESFDELKNEPYNVGLSSANLSKRQLAEKIKKQLSGLTVISSTIGSDPDKRDYIVSNEKLEKTGWAPKVSLDEGIQELIKGYRMIGHYHFSNV